MEAVAAMLPGMVEEGEMFESWRSPPLDDVEGEGDGGRL